MMQKETWILGLLRNRPRHGYELHQIVQAHGDLYRELRKANMYHLLERLTREGYLDCETESHTRGARGEKLIYRLTRKGRSHFYDLLREELRHYEPAYSGIAAVIPFLGDLPLEEAITLLEERQRAIEHHLQSTTAALEAGGKRSPLLDLAADHILTTIEAELAWTRRTVASLHELDAEQWAGLGSKQKPGS